MSSISMKHCSLDMPQPKQRALANVSASSGELFWSTLVHPSVCPSLSLNTFLNFIFFSRTIGPISANLCTKHPMRKGFQLFSNEDNHPITQSPPFSMGDNRKLKILLKISWKEKPIHFPQCDNNKIAKIHWQKDYIGYEPILAPKNYHEIFGESLE